MGARARPYRVPRTARPWEWERWESADHRLSAPAWRHPVRFRPARGRAWKTCASSLSKRMRKNHGAGMKAQARHRRPSAVIFAPGVANLVSRGMDTVGQGAVFIKG